MQGKMWGKCIKFVLLLAIVIAGGGAGTAMAETSSSAHYQMTETGFNAVSSAESCSGHYCAKVSMGDMSAGSGKSSKSTAAFGSQLDSDPMLEVIVDPGVSNLGVLSTEKTFSKTMNVRVRTYLTDGYTLQIVGNPPKYGGHTLSTPSSPTAAVPGTEQFAINTVANTTPAVGTNPLSQPSGETNVGVVNSDYRTPNLFKYTSGDVVARNNVGSGRIDYTISVIVNISNKTPAGHYSGDFSAIVTPIY